MNETLNRNGQRMVIRDDTPHKLVVPPSSERQKLLQAVDDNTPMQQVLARVSTPPGKLLKMIAKAIGPAEAEIEFVERITIRED
jgi:hypothetical protein